MRSRALSNALTVCGTTLALCFAPLAVAAPAEDAPAEEAEASAEAEPAAEDEAREEDPAEEAPAEEAEADPASEEAEVDPPAVEVEDPDAPSQSGGVGGFVTDVDDPEATRATSDLEGEKLEDTDDVPQRMEKLEAAGWWTMFGAVALGTAGGVFAGLAESRVDEAERLGLRVGDDGRFSQYDDEAAEYEDLTQAARTHNAVAISLLSLGGVALVASIALFGVNASKKRKKERAVQARGGVGPTGASLEVKF